MASKGSKNCFGLQESASFARALANAEGIKVVEKKGSLIPYSEKDGTIVVGTPSLYTPDEYMGSLHREISKQMPKMQKLFFSSEEAEGSLRHIAKAIIQEQRSEYEQHGKYEGRDRILSDAYEDTVMKAGGLQKIMSSVPPPIAALLYHGNELRNQWQGYVPSGSPPPELEEYIERTKGIRDKWLSLETPEDLDELLKYITEEEQQQQQERQGNGESGDSQNSQESGESGEGTGEGEGEGQGSGESPESGEGEGEDSDGESEGSTEDSKGESGGNKFSEAFSYLKDSGLLKPPRKYGEKAPEAKSEPYRCTPCKHVDLTEKLWGVSGQSEVISETLGSFSLSKKIRKYLLATNQTGYEYGLKRGKLVNKKISSIYSSVSESQEPRIFKQKRSTKIQVDSAVFILGDCSGSMDGKKYKVSAACQIAMSEVLQGLRIPHMMMQFTTGPMNSRIHYIMKHFDESLVSRDKLLGRYGSSAIQMSSNGDGESVHEASQTLMRRPEKNKILLVLSDGQPAFIGNDGRYLQDICRAIESTGLIHLYGIGIMDNSVQGYYKNHKLVKELGELEHVLLDLLSKNILK